MKIDVTIEKSLMDAVKGLGEEALEEAAADVADVLAREGAPDGLTDAAKRTTPVQTGRLRDSARRGRIKTQRRGSKVIVTGRVPYSAPYGERVLWELDGGKRGRRVWRSMARDMLPRVKRAMNKALNRAVERAVRNRRSGLPF